MAAKKLKNIVQQWLAASARAAAQGRKLMI
jgi:hypothetical protein